MTRTEWPDGTKSYNDEILQLGKSLQSAKYFMLPHTIAVRVPWAITALRLWPVIECLFEQAGQRASISRNAVAIKQLVLELKRMGFAGITTKAVASYLRKHYPG